MKHDDGDLIHIDKNRIKKDIGALTRYFQDECEYDAAYAMIICQEFLDVCKEVGVEIEKVCEDGFDDDGDYFNKPSEDAIVLLGQRQRRPM